MNYLEQIFGLENKKIVITGATGYFGIYFSKIFLKAGADVILMGRSNKLDDLCVECKKKYGDKRVFAYKTDFYDKILLEETLKAISNEHSIDVIVNNAYDLSPNTGFNTNKGNLEKLDFDIWQKSFEAGIYWPFLVTKILGEKLKLKDKSSIINVSSMYGLASPDPKLYEGKKFFNPATYGVAKAGIIALTKYTASFWGRYGIRCNAVAPGAFPNTETKTSNSVGDDTEFLDRLKKKSLLNRVGHPNDLAGVLLLLASDASSFITGQVFSVDGGWTTI